MLALYLLGDDRLRSNQLKPARIGMMLELKLQALVLGPRFVTGSETAGVSRLFTNVVQNGVNRGTERFYFEDHLIKVEGSLKENG